MVPDLTEIPGLSLEERIIKALSDDFNSKSPNYKLTEHFKMFLLHYIELSVSISKTNTIEQILEFLKVAKHMDEQVSVTMLVEYLKTTNFNYRPLKHKSYVRKLPAETDECIADNELAS